MRHLLRQQLCQQRQALSEHKQQIAAVKIADHIIQSTFFKHSHHIALYFAHKGEVDPALIMEAIWETQKMCYMPVLNSDRQLIFVCYKRNDDLRLNQYHILEPCNNQKNISTKLLDLVIVPLVAFDENGNRLGTGKGYYDRTFAFRKENIPQKPHLIGLAYEFQKVPEIIPQAWDIPLDTVVTEKAIYHKK